MFGVYARIWHWMHSDRALPGRRQQTAVMNYVSKFLSNFKEFYNEINSATLTGAIDVVIVQQEDGSYTCSPFHVRFGKIGVLRSREKVVDIEINGEPLDIHMKLGETGEAFFVEEMEGTDDVPVHLATSPIPTYPDLEEELAQMKANEKLLKMPISPITQKSEGFVRRDSQMFNHIDESSSHPASMHGSIYYETSDSISQPVGVNTGDSVASAAQELSAPGNCTRNDSRLNHLTNETDEEPVLNMASLAKAFGHTSISDSALAVIDASTRNASYSKDGRESSSFNGSRYLPISLKDEPSAFSRSEVTAVRQTPEMTNVPQKVSSEQMLMTDDDKHKIKKKRRKKSVVRKRASREVTANVDTSDEEPEEIFQMDVDEDMGSQAKLSSSVPSSNRKVSNTVMPSSVLLDVEESTIPNFTSRSEELVRTTSSLHDLNLPSTSGGHANSWQFKSSLPLNLEIHPFSDGDVTPIMSPVTSRPPTPKSDTEYEMRRDGSSRQMDTNADNRWSWTWGEFPVPPKTPEVRESPASDDEGSRSKTHETDPEEEQRSMLGGVFRFMRKTKKMRHQPESEGIYLDDLNLEQLDPEIAKLYFPPRSTALHNQSSAIQTPSATVKDEDVESGNGSSLPQSPHSVEGGSCSIHGGIDSDTEERHPIFDFKGYNDLAISLCGGLTSFDGDIPQERFLHSLITYDDFCENPSVLTNPDLVVRLNNKYYNWQTASPMVLSLILYQRPLSDKTISSLVLEHMPKKPKKSETKGYSWWPTWRRSGTTEDDDNKKPDEQRKSESDASPKVEGEELETEMKVSLLPECVITPREIDVTLDENNLTSTVPVSLEKVEVEEPPPYAASTSSETDDIIVNVEESNTEETKEPINHFQFPKGHERFRKTLRLTSEQISKLNLREGPNEVVFSVTTAYQGTTRCKCHIYLWHYDDKIVVSDIDGTITKSDVLGHILPIIGKDWAQSGVAQLFTKIKNNGYQFLYLSARAIGQARVTREYLKSIRQGDVCLPDGPLLLNPSSLLSALHREVIEKKPEEFKISCLKDIQALFPTETNPFYAGYGNRINDVWAYRAVGIPYSRTFTINHRGELKHELTNTFQSTYTGLSNVADHLFPPLRRSPMADGVLTSDFEGSEEYSAFTYWRPPFPDISLEDSPVKTALDKSKVDDKKLKASTSG